MIDLCAADLYTKIQAIPAIASATGLAVGGKTPDPGLTKMPLPAAWILFDGATSTLDPNSRLPSTNLPAVLSYAAMLYVPYIGQQDLIANQLPLVELVAKTVHGTDAPTGQRWRFSTAKLVLVNADRMCYRINFLLDAGSL